MALQSKERRTIRIGIGVSVLSLFIAFAVVPFFARWRAREELIAARRDEIARLRDVIRRAPELRSALAGAEAQASSSPRKVLTARSAALAASELQATLQRLAAAAPLSVSALDVTGEPDSTAAGALPASLSAVGDVRAVTAFLAAMRRGPYVMDVSDMRLRPNPSLVGQPLQLSLSLHAPWIQDAVR